MEKMDNKPIWRDEKTGLPMHNHAIAVPSGCNGIISYFEIGQGYESCDCKFRAFDIPMSAIPTFSNGETP